jgi:ParB-like chromosome segregation protein Spo0J
MPRKPKPKPEPAAAAAPPPAGLVVRRVPLDSLHADPANARTHDARNLRAIADSLAEFQQVSPLVVQAGTGRVIGGNGRLEAMRAAGWPEADVVELDIGDVRAAALGIALNRTAELAGWDDTALAATLRALQSELDGDRLLAAVGYDPAELDGLLERMAADLAGQTEPRPGEPDGDPFAQDLEAAEKAFGEKSGGPVNTRIDVSIVCHTEDQPRVLDAVRNAVGHIPNAKVYA